MEIKKALIQSTLDELVSFVKPLLPLANSHMVDFIQRDLWKSLVPKDIQDEYSDENINTVRNQFWNSNSLTEDTQNAAAKFFLAAEKCLRTSEKVVTSRESLLSHLTPGANMICPKISVEHYMTSKKSHEVIYMSEIVSALQATTCASHIVDVGDGKGYLSSVLALLYKSSVIGLEANSKNTKGALLRYANLKKYWKIDEFPAATSTSGELYRPVTCFVNENSDLLTLTTQTYFSDVVTSLGLIGLHTCGNLSPISIKQYCEHPESVKFLVNVGCCYNLLDEGFDNSSQFPMSYFLKNQQFVLGRNARMLSLQAKPRLSSNKTVISDSLFYRAVLQQLLYSKSVYTNAQIGRVFSKTQDFFEYVQAACSKVSIHLPISRSEVDEFYTNHLHLKGKVELFFLLRASLSAILERIILIDRLLWVHEMGFENSYLVQLFDPVVSPRSYAIVSFQKN